MKTVISWLGGGAATCILMMLLSLMTLRRPAAGRAWSSRSRPRVAPARAAHAAATGHGRARSGRRPRRRRRRIAANADRGDAAGNRATAAPAARAGASAATRSPPRGGAAIARAALAWSAGTAWPSGRAAADRRSHSGATLLGSSGGASGDLGRRLWRGQRRGRDGHGAGGGRAAPVPTPPRNRRGRRDGAVAVHTPQPAYPGGTRARAKNPVPSKR